jgi:catechol 2,3-dioxygenase-like lactoylglutathione lyase family enzyme
MQLTHVRLLVRNYADCFRFYRDVLGLAPRLGDENSFYADFPVGGATLALFDRGLMSDVVGTAELPDSAPQQDAVTVILRVADVDALHAALTSRGIPIVNAPHDQQSWGVRCCHLRDPAGNLIELNQPLANPVSR